MDKTILVAFSFLIFLGVLSAAGCSAKAYADACAQCSFDASGKMDKSCFDAKKAAGIACTSTTYPIMSANYARGECPAVDNCASELSSCTAQYGSGDDKADCAEGSMAVCFAASDTCVKEAAGKCGEVTNMCTGSSFILLSIFALLFLRSG
jgi:hypothetical protein